jgi:hypothetical protein
MAESTSRGIYYAVQEKYEILTPINSLSFGHLARANTQASDSPIQDSEKHILLLGDSREQVQHLLMALGKNGLKISINDSLEKESNLSEVPCDLAIVALRPEKLTRALTMLRKDRQHADIPILVEQSYLLTNRTLAGVLSTYRAMPCSLAEIVRLTHRYLSVPALQDAPQARRPCAIL